MTFYLTDQLSLMVFRGVAIINYNTQCFVYSPSTSICICILNYLVVSSLYRSDDSISHAGVTCQVRLLCYVLLYAVCVLFEFAIDTSRHRGRCAEK